MSDLSQWGVNPDDGDERLDNPCPQCGEEMEQVQGACSVGLMCLNEDCGRDR